MSDALSGMQIGFLGLGNMGLPMASRLIASGAHVVGFDPAPAARDRFVAAGGSVVGSSAELAGSEIIILMLPGSAVVEAVLIDGELASQVAPGTLIIDMSSSDSIRTRRLAEQLAGLGVRFMDAPVSGGVKGAQNGALTIMVGGADDDVQAAMPLLTTFGTPRHVGPVAAGHALKALNNLLSATHLWVTSEALLVGERFGLDPATMLDAINGSSGRSASTENKWPKFVLPGTFDSGFSLKLMLKDMRIATSLAETLNLPIALGDAAVAEWAEAAEALPDNADHTEIVRFLQNKGAEPQGSAGELARTSGGEHS